MHTLQTLKMITATAIVLGLSSMALAEDNLDASSQRPPLPPGWTAADGACVKNILGTPGKNPPPSADLVAQAEETCGVQLPPPPQDGQEPRGPAATADQQ